MRHTRHPNPEWGYVAPAPSVMRMDCLIVVAAIILAVAGAATVFSLLHRPAGTLIAPEVSRPVTAGTSVAAQFDWTTGGQIVLCTALGRVACRRFVGERGLGSLSSESEAIRFIDRRP